MSAVTLAIAKPCDPKGKNPEWSQFTGSMLAACGEVRAGTEKKHLEINMLI